MDIEMHEIKELSNNQVRDIESIFRENKEAFMGPVRQAKVGEHCIDLKSSVIRKKQKLHSVQIAYKEEMGRQVQEMNLTEVLNAEIS